MRSVDKENAYVCKLELNLIDVIADTGHDINVNKRCT